MAGGPKVVVINTQERAVSTDINRLQSFASASQAEELRYLANAPMGTDDLDASGVSTSEVTTLTGPLTADVIGGLEVQPQIASLAVYVSPGSLGAIAPDGSETPMGTPAQGDSSYYKVVNDLGLGSANALSMTANGSGSRRIDIIECQVTNVISETDNRDIFNPSTGLFAATSVTKAVQAQLTYRVRLGTAGGGFPGFATGWLPLAVASVVGGATTCDQMTFWDVRPLVEDRIFPPHNLGRDFSKVDTVLATVDTGSFTSRAVLAGIAECNASNQVDGIPGLYRLGGRLRTGSPTADIVYSGGGLPDGLDLNDPNNQSGTWSAGNPVYVYLVEPFLLPRWSRYTDPAAGVRKPRSPRGIIVATTIAPLHAYGCPSAGIVLPALFGFGAAPVNKGVCILATVGLSGQKVQPVVADGKAQFVADGGGQHYFSQSIAASVVANTSATWGLIDGTTHPPNAKAIWVTFTFPLSLAGPLYGSALPKVEVDNGAGALALVGNLPLFGYYNASGTVTQTYTSSLVRIPIATGYPLTTVNRSITVTGNLLNMTGITPASSCFMTVYGYEF
jgi:hypothetical protein